MGDYESPRVTGASAEATAPNDKPVRWVQVVAQPHQLPITCRVARKNWSQEVQLRECAGGAHSGGPPIRSASEALISTASTIVMLPTSPDD